MISAVSLTACGSGSAANGTTASTSTSTSAQPLVLAVLVGSQAEGGPDFVNGMKVAVSRVNAAGGVGGRQIELKSFNTNSTSAGAVAAYRLAAQDPSVAGAFLVPSSGALAVKAVSDGVKLPIVSSRRPVSFSGGPPVVEVRLQRLLRRGVRHLFACIRCQTRRRQAHR